MGHSFVPPTFRDNKLVSLFYYMTCQRDKSHCLKDMLLAKEANLEFDLNLIRSGSRLGKTMRENVLQKLITTCRKTRWESRPEKQFQSKRDAKWDAELLKMGQTPSKNSRKRGRSPKEPETNSKKAKPSTSTGAGPNGPFEENPQPAQPQAPVVPPVIYT